MAAPALSPSEVSPQRRRVARRLSWTALAIDAVYVLFVLFVIEYVLPKRAVIFGKWRYSPAYDNIVVATLITLPLLTLILRNTSAQLARKKNDVVIFLIVLFQGVAVIVLQPVRSKSRELEYNRVDCRANLTEIGMNLRRYARQNDRKLPASFADLIKTQRTSTDWFLCPSSNDDRAKGETLDTLLEDFVRPGHCSYVYHGAGRTFPIPDKFILAHDRFVNHEREGMTILYADGSVVWLPKSEAEHALSELEAGHNPPRAAAR